MKYNLPLITALLLLLSAATQAQTAPAQPLTATILALDKALFDAFNACDLSKFNQYLAEDIEFYQDNDDVTLTRAE